MRRIIQCSAVVLLSACTTFAFASGYDYSKEDLSGYSLQPNFQVNNKESDYARNGKAVYFFGGYLYVNQFLKSTTQTFFNPITDASYTYSAKKVFPSTFSAVEMGVGKEISRYINVEASYIQQFNKTKTGTTTSPSAASSASLKMNGVLGDVGFVFNPDDQFQVIGKLGVMLAQFTSTISVASSTAFTLNDNTKIDPAAGLEFLMQLSKNFGIRLDTMYIANTQNTSNSTGEANALLGLNYAL